MGKNLARMYEALMSHNIGSGSGVWQRAYKNIQSLFLLLF
jgi:hypothetical protein